MPVATLLFSRLQLRTDPFSPAVARDGTAINPPVFTSELDPNSQPVLLHYYFDLYDWSASPLVGGLSSDVALERFQKRKDYQPTLVIVSGTGRTGRGSLTNLILYKIRNEHALEPLRIDATFNVFNRKQSLPQLAQTFINTYTLEEAKPTAEQLTAAFERQMKTIGEANDFTGMFGDFRTLVRKFCKRPIVLVVRGGDHYDLWSSIYLMTAPLIDYIVVETASHHDAATCLEQLSGRGAICHIRANQIDRATLAGWIARRVTDETTPAGGPGATSPLTEEAMDALFAPGAANMEGTVRHPIGWIVETLQKAMAMHLTELGKRGEAALLAAPLSELRIPATTLQRVRH